MSEKNGSAEKKKLKLTKEEKEKQTGEAATQTPVTFPSTFGPNSEFVRLVSGDHHEFIIRRGLVEKSATICDMLRAPCGNFDNTVNLPMLSSRGLGQICQYLRFAKLYVDKEGAVEPFVVEEELGMELLFAANFLGI